MKTDTKITIITICKNAVDTIEDTIQSVLSQTYNNIEYIIVDGASTDGTVDVINRYKDKIDIFISEPDKGVGDAFNKGVKRGTGDYYMCLAADNKYASPYTVEQLVKRTKESGSDIVYANWREFFPNGRERLRIPEKLEVLWKRCVLCLDAGIMKRELLPNGISEEYKIINDWDIILNWYIEGKSFSYLDEEILHFKMGGISNRDNWFEIVKRESIKMMTEKYYHQCPDKKMMSKQISMWKSIVGLYDDETGEKTREVLDKLFPGNKGRFAFWGAGMYGEEFEKIFRKKGLEIAYFLDSSDGRKEDLNGFPVYHPDEYRSLERLPIIVTILEPNSALYNQIERMKLKESEYSLLEELLSEFYKLYIQKR